METKLVRIAQIAKERPKEVFTSLYHHLNEEMLVKCHEELKGDKAVGVDEITKANYAENLKENIWTAPLQLDTFMRKIRLVI